MSKSDYGKWLEMLNDAPLIGFDEACGLKSCGPITISGTFGDPDPVETEQDFTIILDGITIWRWTLWAERSRCRGAIRFDYATGEASVRPITPMVKETADWWRRGLFYALRPVRNAYLRVFPPVVED